MVQEDPGVAERSIVNLLSIIMLEEAGYKVFTHTDRDWEVTTPKGVVIVFKRDTGYARVCLTLTSVSIVRVM